VPVPLPPALELFLDLLRCPTCRTRLHPDLGVLRCRAGHTFDIARHGYVSLLTGNRATSSDDAAIARARGRFLATGEYGPIRQAVARLAAGTVPEQGTVVDVGCGTGYYLAGVLDQLPGAYGLGLDTSVRALRSAARAHERAAAVAWDVFRPFPLADGMVDVVLDVFAPRNPPESTGCCALPAGWSWCVLPCATWPSCAASCLRWSRSTRPRSSACTRR
jgi:23S rRNA (guanine745-N1)-methyltransferase